MENIGQYNVVPISISVLKNDLSEYKSPEDKISRLEQAGKIIRLKRGLYIISPELNNSQVSTPLIANHLYGPSYVSFETALSYHGCIPERTYLIKSATAKRKKFYKTPFGNFEYITVPVLWFAIGLQQVIVIDNYAFIIASAEKALCDLIISTPGVRFQSKKSVHAYLIEDLRMDIDKLKDMNPAIIEECSEMGYKMQELRRLHSFIVELKKK